MKRILIFAAVCLLTIFQAQAVLKEKDLSQTLGVLRAELEQTYKEQKMNMARFEQMNADQHTNLIKMMQKSNQIALMLYSQNSDFTFDMTYACQAATEQYRSLNANHLPYAKMKERLAAEIARYDQLIDALLRLPPRVTPEGERAAIPDSIKAKFAQMAMDSAKLSLFLLDAQGMKDRAACLQYANAIHDNYQKLLEMVSRDEEHYERVSKRVKELNDYAMARYDNIQRSIFINGGDNYFTTLKRFRMHYVLAKKDIDDKYKPLRKDSEWRGPVIFGICFFMLFYILLASLLSYVTMRWLIPKRLRKRSISAKKRPIFTLAIGVAIFAISIMIARFFVKQNFVVMAIDLMITFAWLLEAILVSLLIRLKDEEIRAGARSYTPFLIMAFIVIVFRIILIPNNVVNLLYPPILILFTIWQVIVLKRKIGHLPDSDMIYSVISLLAMVVACVASWMGYVLMAVEIMIWWTIQLTAIQTITCFYDLAKMYEMRVLIRKIALRKGIDTRDSAELKKLHKKMKAKMTKGEYITQTWLYDFIYRALIPIAAILSIPASIYFAAGIFEMSSFCVKIFLYPFLNRPGVIELSLFKLCVVCEMFFLFRYVNYAAHAFLQFFKKRKFKDPQGPSNLTLIDNLISFVVWGLFVIISLVMIQIPGTGISIVMAGLATGMGFAMKDLLENFVYGISLMTGRLRVGDYIECDGVQGKVESINYQSTQIVTLDGSVIAFQNATLFSKNFQNLTRNHGYVRIKIPVGVAYGTNVNFVREKLIQAIEPLMTKNGNDKQIVDTKQGISVAFNDFGDSSVNLFVICWVLVEEKLGFVARVNEIIYNTLNDNHISIPFPQRDVYVRQMDAPAPSANNNPQQ